MCRLLWFACLAAVLVPACSPATPPPREYEIVGQIQKIGDGRADVTIKHEDIKGFMPGMTMTFKVQAPSVLEGLAPGDLVKGTLVVASTDVHISVLSRTGHQDLSSAAAPLPSDGSNIIQPGDAVKDAQLLDETGKVRRFSEWRGHRVAITFVYTRCPLPEFCPLMNRQFRAVQQQLAASPALADVRLLTMSMDPGYDTPQVLKPYAEAQGADPRIWTFLTGSPENANAFMEQFGLVVEHNPSDAIEITHNLRTAVIGADGRLTAVHTGNRWTPAELVADLTATAAPAH